MFGKNDVPVHALLQTINHRLDRTGTGSPSKETASVEKGVVTLTGKLQYENQRTPIMNAVRNVAGIRTVIDQLQSPPR
jgi:osmotically-inducible protein OsmY